MAHRWALAERLRRSYALKLAVALLSVVALTVAVGALVQAQTAEQVRADVQEELTASSVTEADDLDTWLSSVKVQARLTADHPAVESGDADEIESHIGGLGDDKTPEDVLAVQYYDAGEGTTVASSNASIPSLGADDGEAPPFVADPPTFDGDDGVYVSAPFEASGADVPVVAAVSPVSSGSDKWVVYLLDVAARTSSATSSIEGGYTTVVDAEGRYLAHPDEGKLLTRHAGGASNPAVEQGTAGRSDFTEMDDGTLMAYAPVESADWAVVVHAPASQAYALSETVGSNILGLILLAVVSLALVGVTVGSNTVVSLRQLAEKARAMEDGDLDVELETPRDDEFGTLYDSFAGMRDSLRDQISEAERERERAQEAKAEAEDARAEAETRRRQAEQLSSHLETKAGHYEEVMSAAADGDLSVRVDPESRDESMTAIGESLNEMLVEIEQTVANVKRFAATVSHSVSEVEESAEEVMDRGTEVSDSVAEISAGAARQTENLGEVADEMNTLSSSAQQIAATVEEAAATSEQAAAAGELGREAAEEALAEMDAVEEATERTAAEIEELDDEMAAIGEIVEVITEIAEQTNMLALNASIEAARTGADGEGFAVVADEVKNLAEETKESAAEIEGRIERVQSKTARSVEGMHETSERITTGVETVEGAIDALEEIAEYVEQIDRRIREINEATEAQADSSGAVVEMVDEVASISEETAGQADAVADAAAAQTETLASVSADAEDLAERAAELSRLLDDFRVAQGAGPLDETDFETAEVNDA